MAVTGGVKKQSESLLGVLLGVDLVIRKRVHGDPLGKVDGLAESHDPNALISRRNGNIAGASPGVHGAVAEHGLRADQHTRRIAEVVPHGAQVGAVGHLDALQGAQPLREVAAGALKGVVDNGDGEPLAVGVGLAEGALDERVVGVRQDNFAVGDVVGGGLDDDKVGEGDALADEVVDGLAEELLGLKVGQVNVDLADLELEPADGIAHGEAHGSACREVLDLRVQDV